MKLFLILLLAIAILAYADPTGQREPPEKPRLCDRCDAYYEDCWEKNNCFQHPTECREKCELATCDWNPACHKCGQYNLCYELV